MEVFTTLNRRDLPSVLFRLIYRRNDGTPTQHFNADGDLVAEYPGRSFTLKSADDHLAWEHVPTPFISFFGSWKKVMRWRETLPRNGHTDIDILAYDTSSMLNVLSAERIAVALSYSNHVQGGRRKRQYHKDEYLVCCGISGDSYALLCVIRGGGANVPVRVNEHFVDMPSDFVAGISTNLQDELLTEIYAHTGCYDHLKLAKLEYALCS